MEISELNHGDFIKHISEARVYRVLDVVDDNVICISGNDPKTIEKRFLKFYKKVFRR